MQSTLIALAGLPFSGKTTFAKELAAALNIPIISYDQDIYAKYKHEVPEGTSTADEFEYVQAIAHRFLAERLATGGSFIYDDLGLQREERQSVRNIAISRNTNYVLLFFDTPLHIIEQRRRKNEKTNARGHIKDEKMALNSRLLEKPRQDEAAIIVQPTTPHAQIVARIKSRLEALDVL